FRYDNARELYHAVAVEQFNIDDVLPQLHDRTKLFSVAKEEAMPLDEQYKTFVRTAREGGISIRGGDGDILYVYAKCCNPVPGDDVIGIVTVGEGIKVHRRTCHNVAPLLYAGEPRLIDIRWTVHQADAFIAGIRVSGTDRPSMLHDVTHAISSYENTNIRSVTIETSDEIFDGTLVVYVRNVEHLNNLIERIKRVDGITSVERFEEEGARPW
ncbi:MAG TPA: ACT domain-containing protein, partial [Candidatus Kapabacteria bacterium]|nr:ACT domain-containing protein [Candidatus Kapabacteria bacterium]